jgi:hypothetical protein
MTDLVIKLPGTSNRDETALQFGTAEPMDEGEKEGVLWIYVQHEVHVVTRWVALHARGLKYPVLVELAPRFASRDYIT